jgi:hypothetical protein
LVQASGTLKEKLVTAGGRGLDLTPETDSRLGVRVDRSYNLHEMRMLVKRTYENSTSMLSLGEDADSAMVKWKENGSEVTIQGRDLVATLLLFLAFPFSCQLITEFSEIFAFAVVGGKEIPRYQSELKVVHETDLVEGTEEFGSFFR